MSNVSDNSQSNLAQRVATKCGRNVKSATTGTGVASHGRWAETNRLTASAILDEDFPSLSGASAPCPNDAVPSKAPINYEILKQQKPKQIFFQKRPTPEEQFPSLGAAASTLSNFQSTHSSSTYRNIAGYQPAWKSANESKNEKNQFEKSKKEKERSNDAKLGMLTLSKKSGKTPAPMPQGIDDFPDLKTKEKVKTFDSNHSGQLNVASQKKKKNKNKKGKIVGEDLISALSGKFNGIIEKVGLYFK